MDLISNLKSYHTRRLVAFTFQLTVNKEGKKVLENLPTSWPTIDLQKCISLAENGQGHNAIAIKTGRESNLLVLDLDRKNGIEGMWSLKEHGIEIPEDTPCVRSLSGGLHYYFSFPRELEIKSTFSFSQLGFDLRGEGGIIIAPPSTIESVGQYEWVVPIAGQLPPPPETLIDFVIKARLQPSTIESNGYKNSMLDLTSTQQDVLGSLARQSELAPKGTRSERDFALICRAIKYGLSKNAIIELVRGRGKFLEEELAGHFNRYFETTYQNALKSYSYDEPKPQRLREPSNSDDHSIGLVDGYPATDGGRASRLYDKYGKSIMLVKGMGRMVYDGKIWKPDVGEIYQYCGNIAAELRKKASSIGLDDETAAKALLAETKALETKKKIDDAVGMLRKEYAGEVEVDELDKNAYLLNAQNGTINLETGELLPHNPEDRITKTICCNYDPSAKSQKLDAFLERILPSVEVRSFLQRLLGYTITGKISERCLIVLYGVGRNGKSVLVEVLTKLLGDYAGKAAKEILLPKQPSAIMNGLAALRGLRFVSASEINEGSRFDEAFIKEMTGGDTLTARFLYKEYFQFTPRFKMFLLTNHKPKIPTGDQAIWDRLMLVPFTVQIDKLEAKPFEDLVADLLSESEGILTWLVQGTRLWLTEKLNPPTEILEATRNYMSEEDYIGQFIDEECECGVQYRDTLDLFYQTFQGWAARCGIKYTIARNQFARRMEEKGFGKVRGNSGMVILGIRSKTGPF